MVQIRRRMVTLGIYAACGLRCPWRSSYTLFGAYFPFWLLSAVTGIAGALVAHRAFVATGWVREVPYQLSVCTAIGIVVGVLVWLWGTGQL